MKPHLKYREGFWFCIFHGQWTASNTFISAYNKMALRWNTEVYSDKKLPLVKISGRVSRLA